MRKKLADKKEIKVYVINQGQVRVKLSASGTLCVLNIDCHNGRYRHFAEVRLSFNERPVWVDSDYSP